MSLREKVFDAIVADSQVAASLAGGAVFPSFSVESPASTLNRWIILHWGSAEEPAGRDTTARPTALIVSAYDREKDFTVIDALLKRLRYVLRALEGQATGAGGGWVLDVGYPQDSSEDSWDETYGAVFRSETYRIVASGT